MWLALNTTGAYHRTTRAGRSHNMCGASTPNIKSPTSIPKHPHFITTQHPTTITHHNFSSPTNTQQLSSAITFHHQLTPNIQHPLSNTQHKSLWVFQTFSTFAG